MMRQLSYTLAQIFEYLSPDIDISLVGDETYEIHGINTLIEADKKEVSFLSNRHYQSYLSATKAGCVILHPENQHHYDGNKLVTSDPYYAYALLTSLFVTNNNTEASVHPTVCMGEGSNIADDVSIAANVVLGANVTVEQGVNIGANCVVGDDCLIKRSSTIHPNVVLYNGVVIGENCIVHSQVIIGADGFGFSPKPSSDGWQKIHQLGGVVVGDGSTSIGKRCTIAGAVGIVGHLTIVDDVHITAMTLVTKSINESGSYSSGVPMNKTSLWRKNAARFNRLDDVAKQIKALKKILKK